MAVVRFASPTDTSVRESASPEADVAWDDFLLSQPFASHTQSSLWARIKRPYGWEAERFMVEGGERILGGAQILHRRPAGMPFRVGYVPRGPVIDSANPHLWPRLLEEIEQFVHRSGIWLLKLQPHPVQEKAEQWLQERAFTSSATSITPSSTSVVDLGQAPEALEATLPQSTRRNIRLALRNGVSVRWGDADDLTEFHRLMESTGDRKGFRPYGLGYLHTLWRVLRPGGHVHLLLGERLGRAVAGILLIAFGDTVYYKFGGADLGQPDLRASHLLHWEAIAWANRSGYRRYDFEGIDRRVAERLVHGGEVPAPDTPGLGVTFFKLRFGSRPLLLPRTFEKGFGPLRPLVGKPLFSKATKSRVLLDWLLKRPTRHGNR